MGVPRRAKGAKGVGVPPAEKAAFAATLARLIAAAGISPAELARRAGLTDPAVRHYLAGQKVPAVGTLLPLAAALGVTPAALLADWPAAPPPSPPPPGRPKPPASRKPKPSPKPAARRPKGKAG